MQLKKVIEKHGRSPENLLHILLDYQYSKNHNYLDEKELTFISEELNVSKSRIYSLVTFYSMFSTKPRGKYIIQVCSDVPCYVNGSFNVVDALEEKLGIKMGETTGDEMFSLEHTSCIGCCDIAPAIRIGDEVYGDLTDKKISGIINEYRRKCNDKK